MPCLRVAFCLPGLALAWLAVLEASALGRWFPFGPPGRGAIPKINFRFNSLAGCLKDGLDVWWYDRNWRVASLPPVPNLCKEAQGMWLYHDTPVRVRPDRQPLIAACVDGIAP
jgi:hypothetical protein